MRASRILHFLLDFCGFVFFFIDLKVQSPWVKRERDCKWKWWKFQQNLFHCEVAERMWYQLKERDFWKTQIPNGRRRRTWNLMVKKMRPIKWSHYSVLTSPKMSRFHQNWAPPCFMIKIWNLTVESWAIVPLILILRGLFYELRGFRFLGSWNSFLMNMPHRPETSQRNKRHEQWKIDPAIENGSFLITVSLLHKGISSLRWYTAFPRNNINFFPQ